jgi:hypothetical protein
MSERFFERPILNSPYAYPRSIGSSMLTGSQPITLSSRDGVGS